MSLQKSPLYAYFPATDVARARKFYEGKLGLKPGKELAGGAVYQFGENTAAFASKASQAFWQVADVEREVAELKARGVQFENYPGTKDGILTDGGAKAAWFKDSEGNILAIVQSLQPTK